MRRCVVAAVTTAMLLGACTFSEVDPEADVTLRGAAEQADGSALADARVGLDVDTGPSVLVAVPAIIATFGQVCRTAICGAEHTTRTDADGTYAFDLSGSDVQGLLGEEVLLTAGVTGPRREAALAGPTASVDLVVRDEQVQLPTLRTWAPQMRIESDGIGWEPLPAERGTPERTQVVFETLAGGQVWRGPATPSGATVDPRLLEDTTGGVAALLTLPADGPEGVRRLQLRSGTHGYTSQAGVPATRGAPCEVLRDAGGSSPIQPCALTDGDFGSTLDPSALTAEAPPGEETAEGSTAEPRLRIGLGGEQDVALVVVRGCRQCEVTVGERAFETREPFASFEVGATTGEVIVAGELDELTEVSVWTGPASGGLQPVARTELVDADAPATPDGASPAATTAEQPEADEEGVPLSTVLLAMGLLAVAAIGLATFATRRG